ncbi:MAG: hypothetical protein E6772_04680 [Dysgonomonas sp.]|nr:hypothetical protein [Dysgonomonas sp.]
MELFKAQPVLYIISIGLIISACIGGGLYHFLPSFDWNWFTVITIYFLILESFSIWWIVSNIRKKEKKQTVNLYMLTKVIKVMASLIFITIYALTVKENIKSFVGVFIMFYLLYLLAETILFLRIEKQIKGKNDHNG